MSYCLKFKVGYTLQLQLVQDLLIEKELCCIWARWKGMWAIVLKGQSNEIFDPQLFSSFKPAWATDQWVKIVSFLVSFSPRYSNFSRAPRSMILRGVMWLFRILFKGTVKRVKIFSIFVKISPSYRVFRDWLRAVQYDTVQGHSILRRVNGWRLLSELQCKGYNILLTFFQR